jgi:Ca2+-binding EF-hand superfamily protein
MKSAIFCAAALALALPVGASAQRTAQMRFQGMDANHDGVIARSEWRGNARAFRNNDWNGDGVLSGDEVRPGARRPAGTSGRNAARQHRFTELDVNRDGQVSREEWRGSAAVFNALDANRNGVLTSDEAIGRSTAEQDEFRNADVNADGLISPAEWAWNRAAFDRLDVNRDGRLTRAEWGDTSPAPQAQNETGAYRAGYDRGRQDGVQAGKEDKPRHWDLEGQRELETADAGYQPIVGSRADYQAGYRTGFRRGYAEGFGPRK